MHMRESLIQFFPLILGSAAVLQAGLNRKIAQAWSLPQAILLNATLLWLCAVSLFGVALWRGEIQVAWGRGFSPWFLLPGVFGFMMVFGLPWSFAKFGAAQTFVLVVCSQLVTTLIWDWQMEGTLPGVTRIAGIVLTMIGTALACLR